MMRQGQASNLPLRYNLKCKELEVTSKTLFCPCEKGEV